MFMESGLPRDNQFDVPHVFDANTDCWKIEPATNPHSIFTALDEGKEFVDFLTELPEETRKEPELTQEQKDANAKQLKEEEDLRIEQEAKNERIKKEKEDKIARDLYEKEQLEKDRLAKVEKDRLAKLEKERLEKIAKEQREQSAMSETKTNSTSEPTTRSKKMSLEQTDSIFNDLFNLKFIV